MKNDPTVVHNTVIKFHSTVCFYQINILSKIVHKSFEKIKIDFFRNINFLLRFHFEYNLTRVNILGYMVINSQVISGLPIV